MAATTTPLQRVRAILAGSAGNLVEWYDWYAYAACALYFAPVFFPKGDPTAQLLQTAAVFAVGFFARPVGAWLMGLISDRAGRKVGMLISVLVMCVGSLVIALTPGAAQIGVAAPIILTAARILQGLSLGGEYGASATYMSEMGGAKHRGFWASFQYVTMIGGQLTALGVLILLQHNLSAEAMNEWGWRVPFVIGAALAVLVYIFRRAMEETESYKASKAAGDERATTVALIAKHPREFLTILGLTAGGSMIFYVYTTYMQKFLTNTAGFSKDIATEISAAALIVFMIAQPVFGLLSDFLGRRALLIFAFGGGALLTWPILTTMQAAGAPVIAFGLLVAGMLIQSGYTSISGVVKAELFPTNVRTLGVALPYALANAAFGGTAEYVALWFKSQGNESGFYIYCSVVLSISLVAVVSMRDTRRHSRIVED